MTPTYPLNRNGLRIIARITREAYADCWNGFDRDGHHQYRRVTVRVAGFVRDTDTKPRHRPRRRKR